MKTMVIFCLFAAVLSGCLPCKGDCVPKLTPPVDGHTSQNSLDWAGVYEGVLPCADCPGVQTRLTLNRDGSYLLLTRTPDRENAPLVVRGEFTWNAGGTAIALDAKGGGQRFSVGEGRLTLLNPDGTPDQSPSPNRVLTLVPTGAPVTSAGRGMIQTLEDHRWKLDSATDGQGRRMEALASGPERPVVFTFSGSRLSIQGGCNQMTGSYQINPGGKMLVGPMGATMMACEPALMKTDAALAELLAKPLTVDLGNGPPPELRLVSARNEVLLFHGQATPEALYGPGTRIFLEVAAQKGVCSNPLTGDTACLLVRERHYDEHGLVVGTPGAWRSLYESIEGFTHTAGERTVLRVNRFQRTPASAEAGSFVYVLDLKIETEIVPGQLKP